MSKNTLKYVFLGSISGMLLFSSLFVFAQDNNTDRENTDKIRNIRLEELRKKAQMRAENAEEKIEKMRMEANDRMEEVRKKSTDRIQEIRDTRKRDSAQKIVNQLDRINRVWTDHFANVLNRLDAVLQKIKSRAEKAEDNGHNVSSVNSAIQNAENKIATARDAVAKQAEKTYTLDASTVTNTTDSTGDQNNLVSGLREQFKQLRDQLRQDLTSLRDVAMKDARNAVHESFKSLSGVPKVDEEPSENNNKNEDNNQ